MQRAADAGGNGPTRVNLMGVDNVMPPCCPCRCRRTRSMRGTWVQLALSSTSLACVEVLLLCKVVRPQGLNTADHHARARTSGASARSAGGRRRVQAWKDADHAIELTDLMPRLRDGGVGLLDSAACSARVSSSSARTATLTSSIALACSRLAGDVGEQVADSSPRAPSSMASRQEGGLADEPRSGGDLDAALLDQLLDFRGCFGR